MPERNTEMAEVCARLDRLRRAGARSAIVAVAEGARIYEDGVCLSPSAKDRFGEYEIGGAAEITAACIERRIGWESRHLVLGHLQRAGRPIAFDRLFALRLGARAARLVLNRRFGMMAAMRAGEITEVPIADAVAARKALTAHFLDRYEAFFSGADGVGMPMEPEAPDIG